MAGHAILYSMLGMLVSTERASRVLRDARDANAPAGAFSVISHNILAPVYVMPGMFGLPDDALEWPRRRARLCAELIACDSDIVMLQEVQSSTFVSDFQELCDSCKYAVCLQSDQSKRPYANAILYKSTRYELVLEESRSRALILVLRERAQSERAKEPHVLEAELNSAAVDPVGAAATTQHLLYLANVHLQKGNSEQTTRLTQLRSLFKRLALHREQQRVLHTRITRRGTTSSAAGEAPALLESSVIAGDFNSGRQSIVYELMRDSGLARFPATTKRPGGKPGGGVRAYRTGFLGLRDVYQARQPPWGPYTMSHCTRALLDYIWASTDLEVLETMPRSLERAHAALFPEPARGQGALSPEAEADGAASVAVQTSRGRVYLPSADGAYPSDHLPSGCVLAPRSKLARAAGSNLRPRR